MTQTFNVEPYYDDYDKHKHFHKILFRPGYSLQTRELTQMQTMLQDQIRRMGDHLFKNGTVVIPGELSIDNNLAYVKLEPTFGSVAINAYLGNLLNQIVVGGTTGLKAQVIHYEVATTTEPDTIWVKYLDGGTSGTSKVFNDNETISPVDSGLAGYNVQSAVASATGIGSGASIKEGVYYIDGYFVLCEPQVIILDKYTNTPTYSVGFNIVETVATPENDGTLLDNAQGTYNFAAPGAHRHVITLTLTKKSDIHDINDSSKYIELVSLVLGNAQNIYNQTTYAELAKVMARRTYDESGDYVVHDFKYEVREHRNNNRGTWASVVSYIRGDYVVHNGLYYQAESTGVSGSIGIGGTWPTTVLNSFNDGGVVWRLVEDPVFNGGLYSPENGGLEDHIALAIEPGKAYVRGFEIEKVATSFLPIQKSRTEVEVPNGSIIPDVGNYILVTNIHGLPNISQMPTLTFYNALNATAGSPNGSICGVGRSRYFELHSGTIGTATAIYKLGIFDITMNAGFDFARDVKQVYTNAGTTALSFTANVSPILTLQAGTVTASGTSTATVTGTGTLFTGLKVNDVIAITGATQLATVTGITSNNTMAISFVGSMTITTGATFNLCTTNIINPQGSNLIFPVDQWLATMRDAAGVNQIRYTVMQNFNGTTDVSGNVSFSLPTGAGNVNTFAGATLGNYIGVYGNGVIVDLTNAITLTAGNQTVTCAFGGGVASQAVSVIATINKMGSVGTEKLKVLTYATMQVTTEAIGTARTILLPFADGREIKSVRMRAGTWASNNPADPFVIDITNRFTFNDGQTDAYYDLCKLVLADGQKAPESPFEITYEYFEHTGSGDYFTVNSYDLKYRAIPWFGDQPLTDCIDFRPRVDNTGTNFTGTGSSVSALPKIGYNVNCAYQYYNARNDKLCLEPSGDFHVITGIPDVNPSIPKTSPTGMHLCTIKQAPYGIGTSSVQIETIDNRRYTMRDIGKLENRINNLEYYTTLSMTEQGTQNMNITDSTGLTRFKNGFIVDSFNGHGIGDAQSPDYLCSVDSDNKILRPFHTMKNFTLHETNTTNRTTNNYVLTGDLVTLPYTHTEFLAQRFASRFENVNPFAVFGWLGHMHINPETDDWFEGSKLPDIINNQEGNYNSVLNQLTASGQLGTVWNAWQNVWYGTPYQSSVSTSSSSSGGGVAAIKNNYVTFRYGRYGYQTGYRLSSQTYTYSARTTTTTTTTTRTYAQQVGQTRTGVNTTVSPRIDVALVGESIVSKVLIPYMRSRNVSFLVEGLKSGTALHATFDQSIVDNYITPATKISLNNVNGFTNVYDYEAHAGSDAGHAARRIGNNLDLSLNKGMIIAGQTSGATAVVLYQESIIPGSTFVVLHVANVKGTFALNETVIGSMNGGTIGPRGTVQAVPTVKVQGNSLVTNYAGVAAGIFLIPNDVTLQFRCGERELVFKDTLSGNPSTNAASKYSAVGIHTTSQSTYTATRNATVVRTDVSQNGVITVGAGSTSTVSSSTQAAYSVTYVDPLAQTFVMDKAGGAFITKVDLFFKTKETKLSTPVHIEIREVIAGIPGSKVIPFSVVYKDPNDVVVSPTGALATTFTFKSPVYLNDAQEYALVVLSDSNNYNVFISQMGEVDIISNKMISSQPTLGVLFKSSNGSTWNADQMQDLKFVMYRASFNTNVTGYVNFKNGPTDIVALPTDPFTITTGSTLVRVRHQDHNFSNGSTVEISGATTVGNILNTALNGNHVVSNVDPDAYTITVGTAATSSISGGGTAVFSSENALYNTIQPSTNNLVFQNTSIEYQIKTTSGTSADGNETPYIKSTVWQSITPNVNTEFSIPRVVASTLNESLNMAGVPSLEFLATMKSTQENVSPIIDMQRMSCVLVKNKLNAPTPANTNVAVIDDRTILSGINLVGFDATHNSVYCPTSDATTTAKLGTLSVGKYINVSGDVTNVPTAHTANNGNHLVIGAQVIGANFHVLLSTSVLITNVAPNGSNTITITQAERFVDEIAPMFGSALNKYISREIVLAQPATYLKVKLAASIMPQASVDLYYRTNPVGSSAPIATSNWTKANPNAALIKNTDGSFHDIDFDIQNMNAYDTVQVKIVLTSTSTSQPPLCKDLRIIACS